MSEFSFPWPKTDPQIGDGRAYTDEEWNQWDEAVIAAMASEGGYVLPRVWNALACTTPGANQIQIDTGMAIVKGKRYWNDAAKILSVNSAPSGQTRKDSVVLRCDWQGDAGNQYTVRLAIKEGDAASWPTMTQVDHDVWEYELYRFEVDDAGAITGITRRWTGRTRHLLLPLGPNDDPLGMLLADAESTTVWMTFMVPEDFVGNLQLTPIVYPFATGNIYRLLEASGGGLGESIYSYSAETGWGTDAVSDGVITALTSVSLPEAGAEDFIALNFMRDATDPADTVNAHIRLVGIRVSYEADS